MKKFNNAEIVELNLSETANGWDFGWQEGVKSRIHCGNTIFGYKAPGKDTDETIDDSKNQDETTSLS